MTRETPRRRAWRVSIGALCLVALGAGAWGLGAWQPFEHPRLAARWPENLQPLVTFVEDATGLPFLEPVRVAFVADREGFERRVGGTRSEEQQQSAAAASAADEAVGRALGFWDERLDIVEAADALRGAVVGDVAYSATEQALLVHAEDGRSDLDASSKADLVMFLTERLDDQHFHVTERLSAASDTQAYQALVAVSFGQSSWVREQWVAGLDADGRSELDRISREQQQAYDAVAGKYTGVFRMFRSFAQDLGVVFVRALHETGERDAVALAFGDRGPDALDQVALPFARYVHRDDKEPVEAPPVPSGAELLYHRQLGPFGLFLLMASDTTSVEALRATDGWGNDAWTAYRLDGRVCVDGRIVADSDDDADRIAAGLGEWGHHAPDESGVLVGRDGATLLVSACDPGDAAQRQRFAGGLATFSARSRALDQQIRYTGVPDVSECAITRWFETHDGTDQPMPDLSGIATEETIDDLMAACVKER